MISPFDTISRRALCAAFLMTAFGTTMTAQSKPAILEIRYFYLRNTTDNMPGRLNEYLQSTDLAASQKAGAKAIGYFAANLAPQAPFVLALRSWDSLEAYEKALPGLSSPEGSTLPYTRMETQLLRAFTAMPSVAVKADKSPRVFELRTYQSNTATSLQKKIGMFNNGEIAIFRKTGLDPVFFGEMIAGPDQPCLVYLLAYESFAARETNWAKFLADPEWIKLRATPGLSDGEIVSNISSLFLRGLPFSPIR